VIFGIEALLIIKLILIDYKAFDFIRKTSIYVLTFQKLKCRINFQIYIFDIVNFALFKIKLFQGFDAYHVNETILFNESNINAEGTEYYTLKPYGFGGTGTLHLINNIFRNLLNKTDN